MSSLSGFIKTIRQIYANRWILKHWINFRTYDYSYSYELMADMYAHMADDFEKGPIVNCKIYAEELRFCSTTCKLIARYDDDAVVLDSKNQLASIIRDRGMWWM
jgi:hypothetical protein